MNLTITPAPRSALTLEIELSAEELDRGIQESVRRLARRTRVPGFRPGKAPRVMLERVLGPSAILDDAIEELVDRSYRDAILQAKVLPLTQPTVDVVQAEEGKALIYRATVPIRPEVQLGDYRNFNFTPQVEDVTEARVEQVVDELRDQQAILEPVDGRPTQVGDYVVISFTGTRDGEPFEGGSAERMPLILGEERLIPGFEDHLVGMVPDESREFDIGFPADYPEESLRGGSAHFSVTLRDVRARVRPDADDDFARSQGRFESMAELRTEIAARLRQNSVDRARHEFADRIIEYAVANATVELPDVLIDEELEVMLDELRGQLARQGISEEAYLAAIEKSIDEMRAEMRPQAERRAKTLLVLGRIAEAEGIDVPPAEVDAEVERARKVFESRPRMLRYFESERGRSAIRSSLRRSRVVELLIDEWLAAHPDFGPLPHLEDDRNQAIVAAAAESAGASAGEDEGPGGAELALDAAAAEVAAALEQSS